MSKELDQPKLVTPQVDEGNPVPKPPSLITPFNILEVLYIQSMHRKPTQEEEPRQIDPQGGNGRRYL